MHPRIRMGDMTRSTFADLWCPMRARGQLKGRVRDHGEPVKRPGRAAFSRDGERQATRTRPDHSSMETVNGVRPRHC